MFRELSLIACGAVALARVCAAQPSPAVPAEPIAAIIEELKTHDVVAIAIAGYEEDHQLLQRLLRTPELPSLVDDIVVEFGASRYQSALDEFTTGGSVPYSELKKIWQQTTQPHDASDPPVFEAFFRTVREVNATLPVQDRLRVLAAEPPIDWNAIANYGDLLPWLQRRFPFEAELVEREVLDKNRKALLLSGGLHFAEGTPLLNTIEAHGASIYKVWMLSDAVMKTLQPSVTSWPIPSFARIAGTPLGAGDIVAAYGYRQFPPGPFEREYDAVVYLGPEERMTKAKIAPELCSDQEYLAMRVPRLRIAAAAGAPFLAEFEEYCKSAENRR